MSNKITLPPVQYGKSYATEANLDIAMAKYDNSVRWLAVRDEDGRWRAVVLSAGNYGAGIIHAGHFTVGL